MAETTNTETINTETTVEIQKGGKTYLKTTRGNGGVIIVPKPPTTQPPRPTPAYEGLLKNENLSLMRTGALTAAEQKKLIVAIALKLNIL